MSDCGRSLRLLAALCLGLRALLLFWPELARGSENASQCQAKTTASSQGTD